MEIKLLLIIYIVYFLGRNIAHFSEFFSSILN